MQITKDDFVSYERVRESGIINMFDVSGVEELSGLPEEVIKEIMKNYSKLYEMYVE